VVSETRRRSCVAQWVYVRVYALVLVPPNLYIHTPIRVVRWRMGAHPPTERRSRRSSAVDVSYVSLLPHV